MTIATEERDNVWVGLVVKGAGTPVPLVGVRATADIIGRGAKVRIAQAFRNAEKSPVEAVYRFPLPEGAAVCGFRAAVGNRVIEGRIEDRDKAFEKYDEAMAEGNGAYLLDEERPNIFTVSVGNLPPGEEATVEIDYVGLLQSHGSESRFFLPTTISPRYTPASQPDEEEIPVTVRVNPIGGYLPRVPYGIEIRVDIHGKETISSVESPSHQVRQDLLDDRVSVTLTSGTTEMDRDFILTVRRKKEFPTCAYGFAGKRGSFIQIDLSPEVEGADLRQARIFIIDSSGSMMGSSIDQANAALTAVLRGMKEGELFNVFRFGSDFEKFFPNPVPFSRETLDKALERLGRGIDMGGTEILPVIKDACNQVVPEGHSLGFFLLTDGQVSNEKEVVDFVRGRAGRLRLFSLGVGHGVNEHFIRAIARATGGASELAAPGERIEPKALRLSGKLGRGCVEGLSLDSGGCGVQAPHRPSGFYGETVSLFEKLESISMPATIRVSGKKTGGGTEPWSLALPVRIVEGDNLPIDLLWAREAIRDIEEGSGSGGGSRQEGRKAGLSDGKAIDISREFGMLCAATSFVAVEVRKENEKVREEAILRKVPAMLTKDWGGLHFAIGVMQPCTTKCFNSYGRPSPGFAHHANYDDMPTVPVDSRRARYRPAGKPTRKPSRTDLLITILSSQLAGGGFLIDGKMGKAIGIRPPMIQRAMKSFTGADGDLRELLIGTALVLAVLEVRFADMEDQWGNLVEKSMNWLNAHCASSVPKVGRKGLLEWARERARATS